MIIECCSQERTYNKFFGLIGERFCKLNRLWRELFQTQFEKYYDTIHRYETNRLRIIAQFFGHLLSSDAVSWDVLHVVHLNEEDTTSSSRIFIKILIEDLAQGVGMKSLTTKLKDDALQPALAGIFPTDNPKNTRFSINFFTAIGMGALTEGMREWLKNMPKPAPAPLPARSPSVSSRGRSESVSSYSSYSSRSDSRSRSRTPPRKGGRSRSVSRSRSPPRRRAKSPSYDSRSPPPKRGRKQSASLSRSPPPRRRGRRDSYSDASVSRSRSPPPRKRRYSDSLSRSPPPKRAANSRRRSPSVSVSRSPPPRRGRERTISRSPTPPRCNGGGARERSPPRRGKRARSYSSSAASRSPSRSRSPPREGKDPARPSPPARNEPTRDEPRRGRGRDEPARKRRRNTSSPETSRSRSPPPRKAAPDAKTNGKAEVKTSAPKKDAEEDLSHIHPSRRGLMGGGRARASDFM